MHKFGFEDSKFDFTGPSPGSYCLKDSLKYSDVCVVGERHRHEAEIVNIGEGDTFGEIEVERGDINYKQ